MMGDQQIEQLIVELRNVVLQCPNTLPLSGQIIITFKSPYKPEIRYQPSKEGHQYADDGTYY